MDEKLCNFSSTPNDSKVLEALGYKGVDCIRIIYNGGLMNKEMNSAENY
jgi:hypothetical protein